MPLIIPEGYHNVLGSVENTEKAIKAVKDMFQDNLSAQLALLRVTAPMVVMSGMGLNDDLNGVESPVAFHVSGMDGARAEIVHSLAKWKRLKLAQMDVRPGRGIYTDMNALRPEEELDNIHSIYVDQWDWEKVIGREQRTLDFLKKTVRRIYEAIKVTENKLYVEFPQIEPMLPEDIFFIHSEELLQMYPELSPKDHDDWSSVNEDGYEGLNGDLLLWNPVLEMAFEVSSMGIRVDAEALRRQLEMRGEMHKSGLMYHRMLLEGRLPYTIGGGIGQSRLCMFLLRKAHIGEIQSSVWPDDMRAICHEAGIDLV